ncbi:MAG: GNAT family N-acetyltransferase [Pseudomonadota bacterium]
MTTTTLETQRLILRPPDPRDWDGYKAFILSTRAEHAGRQTDLGGAWNAFAAHLGHWRIRGFGLWAVTRKGEDPAIGMVGPYYPGHWPEHELGWVLFTAAEGQGFATEAARAARGHAYTSLGWTTAVSYIAPGNHRSIAVAERLGAALDPNAQQPKPATPCLVYRHPAPEAAP